MPIEWIVTWLIDETDYMISWLHEIDVDSCLLPCFWFSKHFTFLSSGFLALNRSFGDYRLEAALLNMLYSLSHWLLKVSLSHFCNISHCLPKWAILFLFHFFFIVLKQDSFFSPSVSTEILKTKKHTVDVKLSCKDIIYSKLTRMH